MNIPRHIDLLIAEQSYILDALRAYREVIDSGCCNDCGSKKDCEYVPKLGQLVRYNCPFYKRKEESNGQSMEV